MELAKIFSSNMVFQANKPLRFFGTGKGKVAVTLHNETYEREYNDQEWLLELPSQPYGGPFDLCLELQGKKIYLNNIAFGDVFLCAGQSNMQFTVAEEKNANPIRDNPYIRYFVSDRIEEHTTQKSADGWTICKSEKVGDWSALALHIAENHQEKHGVFVGIVGCFQGASSIQSWTPEIALGESIYIPLNERHLDAYSLPYSVWNGDAMLYNRTFLPLVPFAFKAVVWYQGESNTSVAESRVYTELLSKMIVSWRNDLKDPSLPFVVVEICDFDGRNDDTWHAVQSCQQKVAKTIPNVTTVTSKDVCEHNDIHPSNKEKLAEKIFCVL